MKKKVAKNRLFMYEICFRNPPQVLTPELKIRIPKLQLDVDYDDWIGDILLKFSNYNSKKVFLNNENDIFNSEFAC